MITNTAATEGWCEALLNVREESGGRSSLHLLRMGRRSRRGASRLGAVEATTEPVKPPGARTLLFGYLKKAH